MKLFGLGVVMACSLLLALATKTLFPPQSEAAVRRPAPDAAPVVVTLIQPRPSHGFPRLSADEAARNMRHGSAQADPVPASRPTVTFSGLE